MGIVVDQRAMAFNGPRGNNDIIYFVFTLYNVSARDAAVYNNPTIDPALRADIAALGARFQDSAEARLGVAIPDGGYHIDSLFAGLTMDPDVAEAGTNYATAILPFDLGLAYKSNFVEPFWDFPLEIFGPPLEKATGFVGVRVLKSPGPPLRLFTTYTGSASGYPVPVGVNQLWRYLAGTGRAIYRGEPGARVPRPGRFHCGRHHARA
jgi:hypothetical protein